MKHIIRLFICILLFSNALQAQNSNAVLFTENGERFTVILNGVRQNNQPETNVRMLNLNAEFYKLKVIFENKALKERNFNMALQTGMENTFVVKKNNKGEYVLRFIGAVPVSEAPRPVVQQPAAPAPVAPVPAPVTQPAVGSVTQTVTTTQTTSSTQSQTADPDAVNFNMGVSIPGGGANFQINMNGMDQGSGFGSTTTTTSTTISQSQTVTSSGSVGITPVAPAPVPPPAPIVYLPGYNGPVGCPVPMSAADFNDLEQSIASKKFEDSKLTMAKQVLRDRCLFVSQVKKIMLTFTFEETRLDFAKFAYPFTYDIGNYFKVNDAFTFETSIEELDEYIRSR